MNEAVSLTDAVAETTVDTPAFDLKSQIENVLASPYRKAKLFAIYKLITLPAFYEAVHGVTQEFDLNVDNEILLFLGVQAIHFGALGRRISAGLKIKGGRDRLDMLADTLTILSAFPISIGALSLTEKIINKLTGNFSISQEAIVPSFFLLFVSISVGQFLEVTHAWDLFSEDELDEVSEEIDE